jgi:hypothetical protein
MFSARLTDIDTPCDRMRELELIASIQAFQAVASTRAQNASASQTPSARVVRIGIGDDCAVLRPPHGHDLVVTTDLLLETTHFRRDWHSPEAVGYRCLARGLSDLAAMGAQPVSAFLSFEVCSTLLTLPKSLLPVAIQRRHRADARRCSPRIFSCWVPCRGAEPCCALVRVPETRFT